MTSAAYPAQQPTIRAQIRGRASRTWNWLARQLRVAVLTMRDDQGSLPSNPPALRSLIRATRVALVTTRGRDGSLHSEPMETVDRPFDGQVWLSVPGPADLFERVQACAAVQLTYIDRTSTRCVVLDGIARTFTPHQAGKPLVRIDIMSADVWE